MSLLTGKSFKYSVRCLSIVFLILLALSLFFWEIEEKVPAKGIVENEQQITVRSQCEKTLVNEILKKPGERVKKDEVILRFADIRNLKHRIKEIELKIAEGRTSFKRMTKLHKSKLISDAEHEKLKLKLDLAENQLALLQQEYSKLHVKAPYDSIITNFHIDLQEPVKIGTELFTLIGNESKIIRCIAPQSLAYGLKKGQRVNIKSNLKNYLRYRVYDGILQQVAPYGTQKESAVHYELIVNITDGQNELPVGSTAMCEVIIGKAPLIFILIKGKDLP